MTLVRPIAALAILVVCAAAAAQEVKVLRDDGALLVGELRGVHGGGLRIASEETGLGDVSWSEVVGFSSETPVRIELPGGEVLVGVLIGFDEGSLTLKHELLGDLSLPVSRLEPAREPLPRGEGEPDVATPLKPFDWKGKVSLGITATGGNSDTFTGALDAFIERNFSHDHLEFALRAVYGTSEGETNANNQLLRGKWEHYYSDRLYAFLGAEVSRDEIQEIALRFFLNVGLGYVVWKESDDQFLKVEGGIGYRHESFQDDTPSRDDLIGRAALIYRNILFDSVRFGQLLEFILPFTDTNAWLARSETTVAVPVSEHWAVNTKAVLNYQNDPADAAESFDWIVTAGIEYSF